MAVGRRGPSVTSSGGSPEPVAARGGLPYSKNALLVGPEGSKAPAGQLEAGSRTSDTCTLPSPASQAPGSPLVLFQPGQQA